MLGGRGSGRDIEGSHSLHTVHILSAPDAQMQHALIGYAHRQHMVALLVQLVQVTTTVLVHLAQGLGLLDSLAGRIGPLVCSETLAINVL